LGREEELRKRFESNPKIKMFDFSFPEPIELKLKLKDLLEDEVDEKYFLKPEQVEKIMAKNKIRCYRSRLQKDVSNTLSARDFKSPKCIEVHNCLTEAIGRQGSSSEYISSVQKVNGALQENTILDISQIRREGKLRVYDKYCKTLNTAQGGGHTPLWVVNATKKGYLEANIGDSINLEQPNSKTRRGRVQKEKAGTLQTSCNQGVVVYDDYNSRVRKDQDVSGTLTQNTGAKALRNGQKLILETRVRRLTPKECFRLQGFLNDEVNIEGLSDTQKYKLAGNGQSVNVVKLIFKELLK